MEINSRIHLIKSLFEIPVAPGKNIARFVNIYVIAGEKIHLIDTGVADSFQATEEYLIGIGRDIKDVASILLTHSHPDHIGAARQIKKISGCKVYAHPAEKSWIENTALQYSHRPVPGFGELVGGPVTVDFEINDGQILSPEPGLEIKCIHTPGHSAGSVCFLFEPEKILFSGDAVLLPGEIPVFENTGDYFRSVQKIREAEPEILLSAWDEPRRKNEIPGLLENSNRYILKIQEAARLVASPGTDTSSMEFCLAVVKQLGLPETLANPLLLKSFRACL